MQVFRFLSPYLLLVVLNLVCVSAHAKEHSAVLGSIIADLEEFCLLLFACYLSLEVI